MANFQLFQNNESKHFSCGLILRWGFLVKLYAYSVQAATLLQRDLTTYFFQSIYREVAVLKRMFLEKRQWWARVLAGVLEYKVRNIKKQSSC